jgi:hypothetical protein
MNALAPLERPGTDWLRALCIALFVAPGVIAVLVAGVVRTWSTAPDTGSFQPTPRVVQVCLVAAVVYAAVFIRAMNRLRLRLKGQVDPGARGDSLSPAFIWLMGLFMVGMVAMLGAIFVCGALNRATGEVSFESWRVWNKVQTSGKGCHFRVDLVSRVSSDATRLCVPRERWDRLSVNDSLQVVTVIGALGEQVGLAPEQGQEPRKP